MPSRPLLALLACVLLSCSRAEPAPPVVPEPVPVASEAPSSPGGMAPPPAPAPAAPAPSEEEEPVYEPPIDPATVVVPPLDEATEDALAAFVAVQRSIAAESSSEVHGANDFYDVVVSPKARAVLPSLKRAAREAVRRVLGAASGGQAPGDAGGASALTGKVLSVLVMKAFAAAGAAVDGPTFTGSRQSIGEVVDIEVSRPAGHPDKFAVVVTLSLPCGSDGSFYVLEEQRRGAPRVVMAVEANGYTSISDGNLALTAKISPLDDRGGWFAVVAHAHPWCSSAWRGIEYGVFLSGGSPEAPRRVLHEADSAYLNQDLCEIRTGGDDFTVHYVAWSRFTDDWTRPYVHHYERRDGAFVRVQPIVERAIDLPGEWARMPWTEARRFVSGADAAALRPWHEVLARAEHEFGVLLTMVHEDAAAGRARFSLTCTKCKTLSGRLLVDVRRDGPGWVMEAVSRAP